ncbi:MAG TPA: hypothetical protein VFV17_07140 [Usitatibacteraceae bacterium]|nr:hypothetical protein [Usitatibacteraceae bacterium]
MATSTSPDSRPGGLFFSDARSCKEWLKTLQIIHYATAQQSILDALRILASNREFAPLDRLTCLELMRDKIALLLGEQRARYAGKTIPLSHGDSNAWQVSNALLREMENGYARCWDEARGEDAPMHAHAALILQRTIRYIGLQMLIAGFIYRRFDTGLWLRLHTQWVEAESRGLQSRRIKDSIGAIDGYSSVQQAYTAVLLGQAANVYELMPREIDFVDAILKRFGHKVEVMHAGMPTALGSQCVVDVLSSDGAIFVASAEPADHIRVLNLDELSKSMKRRLRKLADGEDPRNLDLPPEWSAPEAARQLVRLHRLWCEGLGSRPPGTIPAETSAQLAFGIAETHFFLSGSLFEQPDVKRELTRQELNDIKMFGKVSEATTRARYAEYNYGTETWGIVDESRGSYRLLRPANSSHGMAIGRLLGVKIGNQDHFYLGYVTGLVEELDGMVFATVTMLPGRPEAIAVRGPENRNRAGTYAQGFRLAPMPALRAPETLVIPNGMAQQGKAIDIFHPGHGSPKQVKVLDFTERGLDFDRVTID